MSNYYIDCRETTELIPGLDTSSNNLNKPKNTLNTKFKQLFAIFFVIILILILISHILYVLNNDISESKNIKILIDIVILMLLIFTPLYNFDITNM